MRLIDAEEFDVFSLKCPKGTDLDGFIAGTRAVLERICDAPTVDAEPVRHGEWIKIRGMMPPEYMGLKACSVCGWHIHPLGRTAFDLKESEFRYCPRCGARLDRERRTE